MQQKHVVIIGLGGVGGYFGFKICQSHESDEERHISFLARAKTHEVVEKVGLTLLSPEHEISVCQPNKLYQHINEIKCADLVLICVKEYDLEAVCMQLNKVVSDKTVILPMMNGVDIYDRIRRIMPTLTILPSCIYVASHIKSKGVVEHKGKAGKLIFGLDPNHKNTDIDWIIALLEKSRIDFDYKEDALLDIWTKFIFVTSFGIVTAKYNSSIGEVCTLEKQRNEAANIMQEIKSIADAIGVGFSDDIVQATFLKAATFPPETPTSLQLDVHSGKGNTELELFAGAIIKYGMELRIDTTYTAKIYQELNAMLMEKM